MKSKLLGILLIAAISVSAVGSMVVNFPLTLSIEPVDNANKVVFKISVSPEYLKKIKAQIVLNNITIYKMIRDNDVFINKEPVVSNLLCESNLECKPIILTKEKSNIEIVWDASQNLYPLDNFSTYQILLWNRLDDDSNSKMILSKKYFTLSHLSR